MTLRSPEDAKVAVRSFPRRFDELLAAAEGRDDVTPADLTAVADAQSAAAQALSQAATALGGVGSDVLRPAADELTAVIERRPADDWEEDVHGASALATLDAAVTAAAAALRQAEDRVGRPD